MMAFFARRWPAGLLRGLGLVAVVLALVAASAATAQESYVVGLFAPNLDFKDGVARNDYVKALARVFAAECGGEWDGQSFARPGDFEAALRKGALDVVVVDGEYFAAKGASLVAVGALTARGEVGRPLKVVTKRNGPDALHKLRGKTLALVSSGGLAERFVSGDVLGAEIAARDFFGRIEEVRDVRSALNAVDLGKADAALAFEGYEEGFRVLYTTQAVPLPVVAVASTRISGELLAKVKRASRSLDVSGADLVNGSAAHSDELIRRFRSAANRKKSGFKLELIAPTELQLELGEMVLLERKDRLEVFAGAEPLRLPELRELDALLPDL